MYVCIYVCMYKTLVLFRECSMNTTSQRVCSPMLPCWASLAFVMHHPVCSIPIWIQCVPFPYGSSVFHSHMDPVCSIPIWIQCVPFPYGSSVFHSHMDPVCSIPIWIQCVPFPYGSSVFHSHMWQTQVENISVEGVIEIQTAITKDSQ